MKSDYKILGKFIAILLTLLVILITFNSNEAFFNTQKHNDSMFSDFDTDNFFNKSNYKERGETPNEFGKTYNAMQDDNLIEINKHVH